MKAMPLIIAALEVDVSFLSLLKSTEYLMNFYSRNYGKRCRYWIFVNI